MKGNLGRFLGVGALVVFGGFAGFRGAGAHEGEAPHPTHIHVGSCAAPGEVVAPLSDVSGSYMSDATPMAGTEMVGQATAGMVDASTTTVPMAMTDLLGTGHAIVAHKSAEEIGTYIACGDIGGMMMGASDLAIGLGELGGSGYSGIALLHDNGDGTTKVSVFLNEPYSEAMEDAAHGTPESGDALTIEGTRVDVTLQEFSITTSMPTLRVGETYTFVAANAGKIPHEMVVEKAGDDDVPLKSGDTELEMEDIAPGTSKALTMTFDTPGKYQLACNVPGHYEGGMVITFEVFA